MLQRLLVSALSPNYLQEMLVSAQAHLAPRPPYVSQKTLVTADVGDTCPIEGLFILTSGWWNSMVETRRIDPLGDTALGTAL